MLIGMVFGNGYGSQAGAWRMPGVDPTGFTNFDTLVRYAQLAERGKFQFLFMPDFPALRADIATDAQQLNIEPMMTLAAVARGTERIGLVATGSSTFSEPFNLARQFKALDLMSHGRAGWNAVPTSDPMVAANFGRALPPRAEKYERLHEFVQIVQGLWGSWEQGAWLHDQASGRFADPAKIKPVNLRGRHLATSGPLPLPPSEQGQPVIFQAGGGDQGLEVAGRYASGVIGAVFTMEDARAQRMALRDAAERAGRDPDEIKFFAGLMTTIAPNRRAALDRRIAMSGFSFEPRVGYLGQMLGLALDPAQLGEPLTKAQLAAACPSRQDPRSMYALKVASEGWSLGDVLAHGVIDYHPVIVGPAVEAADHMQTWFEAGAADGFWLCPDVYEDGLPPLVEELVPVLQERGLFHRDYQGATLRDHLGVPAQYGRDPRLQ
ncbi:MULTISPECIES: NtaA/DmoA family FMN-dependent monooxygenase [Sphingomonas]|jgi:FMN-dependent oxidoreductase (nitrilotriacetate monooxygenase family)|uniref:NtaA/DmoA family FMN-dependent monooxygenase n=1 Tax=Sphingomonas TaxID=13687 RepID=UPI0006FD4B62|nr:NtaA/DmoA family FMN-dependent monooxygenase [Sphingomonas sp. Leaf38]KQN33141.1 nitrilotriacetate monooxygenase [Sphingomonas sp. Leaf38]